MFTRIKMERKSWRERRTEAESAGPEQMEKPFLQTFLKVPLSPGTDVLITHMDTHFISSCAFSLTQTTR